MEPVYERELNEIFLKIMRQPQEFVAYACLIAKHAQILGKIWVQKNNMVGEYYDLNSKGKVQERIKFHLESLWLSQPIMQFIS